ncbi:MAG: Lipopolysaccharide core biosynthesis protein RfaG [Verrucomicrobiota bacterium]|jgi:UDP-glucose:(heptosyl)LPS alpha-1,3-glucosyltransferase
MRIGLVRRGFSSSGGAEAFLRRFAEAVSKAGHSTVLFSDTHWPDWNGELLRLPASDPLRFADALQKIRPRNHCDFLLSFERVWECDAFRAGDGLHASWLQRRAAHEPPWKPWFRRFSKKHQSLVRLENALFSGGARRVIANSGMVRDEILARHPFPAEHIRVVYNGLPAAPPRTANPGIRAGLGLGPEDFVLLFVGSGWERKGLRFAIHALQQAPEAGLLVAGRGSRRGLPNCERVQFLGPRSDIPDLLSAADAFVLPTLYDPFSNASLEALAAGLPVITTTANGVAELLTPGVHGSVLDNPAATNALAAAYTLWADSGLRAATRPARLERASGFTIERNLQETFAALGLPVSTP